MIGAWNPPHTLEAFGYDGECAVLNSGVSMSNQTFHRPILTIGYGNRAIGEFLTILQEYDTHFVGDVRTTPYSRFAPDFSREQLIEHLSRIGTKYVYLGDSLGGNPDDDSVRQANRSGQKHYVNYDRAMALPPFQAGIARLFRAWEADVGLTLLCSEAKPEACHRARLIGAALDDTPIEIMHIDEYGELRSQAEIMLRIDSGQALLPGLGLSSRAARSSKAFE